MPDAAAWLQHNAGLDNGMKTPWRAFLGLSLRKMLSPAKVEDLARQGKIFAFVTEGTCHVTTSDSGVESVIPKGEKIRAQSAPWRGRVVRSMQCGRSS